jgi:beta-glucosidase
MRQIRPGAFRYVAMALAVTASAGLLRAQPATRHDDRAPDTWARDTEARMTDDERLALVSGFMPLPFGSNIPPRATWPKDVVPSAGYVFGVPRLGVASLRETDASLGVTNPFGIRPGDSATALPAGIALGATFNPELAYRSGRLVGAEARAKGFNVLLGGGMNLMRDPRNGRNFEYLSEDPLLAGMMAGAAVRGTQDAGVVSTVKHFSLNSNETNRQTWNAAIDRGAHRESDLLAFQIAIEQGRPGAVMCAYNLVNAVEACDNPYLLNDVLKRDWGFRGWVMSDWGAVPGWEAARHGLDQQSGWQLDAQHWFGAPLRQAMADGGFDRARLGDMVRRILRSMRAVGIDGDTPAPKVDLAAHEQDALDVARQGIVLLKNDGALPLAATVKTIAVIGGFAETGVLSGGGSSQVLPPGGWALSLPVGGPGTMGAWRVQRWFAGSPVGALKAALPDAKVEFDPGLYPQDAAALARRADVAVVFVHKYEIEGYDSPDLALPGGQDAIVEAAVAANPNTIVVLETGNPVAMPWRDKARAIVAAWYPGQEGARAIADILTGKANPSGRLPISWPASTAQLPRPEIPSYGTPPDTPVTVALNEGADVGYRWYGKRGLAPAFPFGHGLSYTSFAYDAIRVAGGARPSASVTVRNTGPVPGADVPQLYLQSIDGAAEPRLLGFARVELAPGAAQTVNFKVDPRLLAHYDEDRRRWVIRPGRYTLAVARDAATPVETVTVRLAGRSFPD